MAVGVKLRTALQIYIMVTRLEVVSTIFICPPGEKARDHEVLLTTGLVGFSSGRVSVHCGLDAFSYLEVQMVMPHGCWAGRRKCGMLTELPPCEVHWRPLQPTPR